MFLNDVEGQPPPPFHSWTAGIIHDIVVETVPNLRECIPIGPGSAILLFGRRMEPRELLYLQEAQDLVAALPRQVQWVGKTLTQQATPLILAKGHRAIPYYCWLLCPKH